tara:strand:- start:501 stop:656 length:156 start_codon:yes stop_codon:yes gene_type:complete
MQAYNVLQGILHYSKNFKKRIKCTFQNQKDINNKIKVLHLEQKIENETHIY